MRDYELAKTLVSNLDLTSLHLDDTEERIASLCQKAETPCGKVAAVCVYAPFVSLAKKISAGVKVATVVNFPQGGTDIESTVNEIKNAISYGADEIDAVFPYKEFLNGNSEVCRKFLTEVRKVSAEKTLKIILESGAFPNVRTLRDACRLCLEYDINFLKTSTGKTEVSATVEAANVILEAIRESQSNVGFKASGGIKTFEQARQYYVLAQSIMGEDWPNPEHFRIGASSLLDDLISVSRKGY